MNKTILMHREGGGLVQPISRRPRGSAVIYMLMLLLEGMKTGQGVTLCCQWRRFSRDRSTVRGVQPASLETHLLVLIWSTKSIYTLLNQMCRMPAPAPPPLLWHTDAAAAFQTQIRFPCKGPCTWFGGHIKCFCAPRFCSRVIQR